MVFHIETKIVRLFSITANPLSHSVANALVLYADADELLNNEQKINVIFFSVTEREHQYEHHHGTKTGPPYNCIENTFSSVQRTRSNCLYACGGGGMSLER